MAISWAATTTMPCSGREYRHVGFGGDGSAPARALTIEHSEAMSGSSVPGFRYHLDPVATGEVRRDMSPCAGCGTERGYLYVGPLHGSATEGLQDRLCPWCIADGSAAERFGVSFIDTDWGVPDAVPAAVLAELSQRTPSFTGWQQERWFYHCDDATAYMGRADHVRLASHPNALWMVLHENDEFGWPEVVSTAWVESMSTDGSPTAYLFRCLHCGIDLAYADME